MDERERRKHQRQEVLLPLRVTSADATGGLLYQGITINVGAGGVYFRTYAWRGLREGMPVNVLISVPPEMTELLPFGGMTGQGTVVRVEESGRYARLANTDSRDRPTERGVALQFLSRLKFEADWRSPITLSQMPPSVQA